MKLIHPGQHDVKIGRFSPFVTRSINSADSSIIVKSALKSVSNTASKPSFFNAAASFLVTEVPAGIPNSSPIATRIAGATCTTTVLFSSLISSHTSLMYDFSVRAPVGQTATHCPQNVHCVLESGPISAGLTTAWNPLPNPVNTPTV